MSSFQFDEDAKPIFSRGPMLVLKLMTLMMLSGGLMAYDQKTEMLAPIRDNIAVALTPIQWISSVPYRAQQLVVHFRSREDLIAATDNLQHEHLRLNARLQKLLVLEEENKRIRELLNASKQIHNEVMIAEILSTSLDPYQQRIRINRGKLNGTFNGQALIDAYGILGQIIETTPYSSTAVLITDESQGIPVQVNRNSLRTVAHGTGGMRLKLPFLPANSDIEVGDLLISSGLGGRYPEGYPVGTVEKIEHHPGEHFLEIYAVPAARMQSGNELLLVRQGVATHLTADLADPTAKPGRVAAAD